MITKEKWGTLARAASVGPIIIILGFTLIGGIYNLMTGDFTHAAIVVKSNVNPRLLYFSGVVISTIMFLPIVASISFLGGILGRKHFNKR